MALADQIAYQVVSSDPALVRFGMTQSWHAVEPFREGIARCKDFELNQDYRALNECISEFREAVQYDPNFALAHYRLGRALAADGQPGLAIEAFQAAINARPDFSAAHIELANVEYWFDQYYYDLPPSLKSGEPSPDDLAYFPRLVDAGTTGGELPSFSPPKVPALIGQKHTAVCVEMLSSTLNHIHVGWAGTAPSYIAGGRKIFIHGYRIHSVRTSNSPYAKPSFSIDSVGHSRPPGVKMSYPPRTSRAGFVP
jgi:hypothetical protein